MGTLKKNIVKYRLIEEHLRAVRACEYEYAEYILHLLRSHKLCIGLGNDAGFALECFAEKVGCRVSYSRNYYSATIRY